MRVVPLLLTVLLTSACAAKKARELPSVVDVAEQEVGVEVRVFAEGRDALPPMKHGTKVEPVEPAVAAALLPVVTDTLAAYPRSLRDAVMPNVWVVGRLQVGGVPFLGLAQPREKRFLVALRRGTTPVKLRRSLHHEVAHLIERHPDFDREAWRRFSLGDYVGAKPNKKWRVAGRPWERAGFVSRYASKNPAEDWAELAELAFTHPVRARRLARAVPRIGDKLVFLTRQYRAWAPGMVLPWADAPKKPPRS